MTTSKRTRTHTDDELTYRLRAAGRCPRPKPRVTFATASTLACALLFASAAHAQYMQQGSKLVGTGAAGWAFQGGSVALSTDGNTALVGAQGDNHGCGAVWVFVRAGGVWTQQGSKLVGTGAVGHAAQGTVAVSADGNTAVVGGFSDSSEAGAAWVFTRTGGVWTQQGGKLVGGSAVGAARQGAGVALSADGNTLIVGGYADNSYLGAVWVFTRSGGVWAQQGEKLVGSGAVGGAEQGRTVALSADGSTAIVGGYADRDHTGAAWVFTRSGGVWTQQGGKLVGRGAMGMSQQGTSVALSADGDTAIVGARSDDKYRGATWVFVRSKGLWTQQGNKLVGRMAVGPSSQGASVALSSDGNTAVLGAPGDDGDHGAFWTFTRSGVVWTQKGGKTVGSGAVGSPTQGAVAVSSDGSTVIMGGAHDSTFLGAAWVFTAAR
jgi:hypothetical protein